MPSLVCTSKDSILDGGGGLLRFPRHRDAATLLPFYCVEGTTKRLPRNFCVRSSFLSVSLPLVLPGTPSCLQNTRQTRTFVGKSGHTQVRVVGSLGCPSISTSALCTCIFTRRHAYNPTDRSTRRSADEEEETLFFILRKTEDETRRSSALSGMIYLIVSSE